MITRVDNTIEALKSLWIELFLDKTNKVSNVADGSVLNATAYGTAKIAQKAIKDIAITEAKLFPDTAVGTYLDECAALYGVSPRKGALGSSTYVRVYANPDTVYSTDVVFVNKNGIRFSVDKEVKVGSSGYAYVPVRSINAGSSTNVPPNSIVTVTPQPTGHIECTNEYYAIGGRDSEDDETFRIRIKNNNNRCSKGTQEYWTQILQDIDPRVLKVLNVGLGEDGIYELYIVSQNGIFFTEDELNALLEQSKDKFGIFELNLEGDVVGIAFKNAEWFYIGSERGMDFRVDISSEYTIADVRRNIQVSLTKYLDFRFWEAGQIVQWDDLLDVVKKASGVRFVPDEFFFPNYDEAVPVNQLPRIREFVMRDLKGNILYDAGSTLSPLFYPAQAEDIYRGITDSSLSLSQPVYFNVIDEDGNPVEGARITVGSNAVITDSNGQATMSLINGNYTYIITKNKMKTVTGTFVVLNNSVTINAQMVIAPFTVIFDIRDENGLGLQGAEIIIDDQSEITDGTGRASIDLKPGTYIYSVSKLGYEDITNKSVTVVDANVAVMETMYLFAWSITFICQDENAVNLSGVIVKIGSNSYVSDENGRVPVKLVNGNYKVSFSKVGFVAKEQNFTVNNKNETFTVQLVYFKYNFSMVVYAPDGKTPAPGVNVNINEGAVIATTNSSGRITAQLINGDYNFVASKREYDDYNGNFNIQNADLDIEVTMKLRHFTVVITAVNENQQAISGATVNINNEVFITDPLGQITTSLQNGTYPYTITRLGYYDYNGSIQVNDGDVSDIANMTGRLYDVLFIVKDGDTLVQGATILIFGRSLTTNTTGQASTQLTNGKYPYTVSKTGFNTTESSVIVANDNATVNVSLAAKLWNVFLQVLDRGQIVEGAEVQIAGQTLITDDSGLVTLTLRNGTYPYTINKAGYVQETGNIVVNNSDLNTSITITPLSYLVTFKLSEEGQSPAKYINGATISINSQSLTTDSNGEATIQIYAGTYPVSYKATGYQDVSNNISISGVQTIAQALKKFWALQFSVAAATKEALEGATVTVEGAAIVNSPQTVTTNAQGLTPEITVVNGAYTYGISKTGYSPEEGSGTIANGNKTETHQLVFGFETVFHVTDNTNNPITGATVLIDNVETITTSSAGNAVSNLSNGNHTYVVTKAGYIKATGTVTVNEAPQTVNVKLTDGGLVTFTITDQNVTVSGVTINITGSVSATGTTNNNGVYAIELPNGTFGYTLAKSGYQTTPSANFTVNSNNVLVNRDIAAFHYYTITFTNVVNGSSVVCGGETKTAPSGGTVTFTNKVNGSYDYSVTKDRYRTITGSVTVNNNSPSVRIAQVQISTVTFTCIKDNDASQPYQNVVVNFNGKNVTTNAQGKAAFTDTPNGTYNWTATPPAADGAETQSGSITVSGADVNTTVNFDMVKRLTFMITDLVTGANLEGVTVSITGSKGDTATLTTSSTGVAQYMQAKINSTYSYTISKTNYVTQTGTTPTITDNTDIRKSLDPKARVTFTVTANTSSGAKLQGVAINCTASGETAVNLTTDSNGLATAYFTRNKQWTIAISKSGYDSSTFNRTWTATTVSEPVTLTGIYSITVNTKRVGVNYSGVALTLEAGGKTLTGTTNASGVYVFSNVPYDLNAKVSWAEGNYWSEGSLSFSSDSSKTVTVNLSVLYDLIFATGQQGATVKLTGGYTGTVTTGTDGNATFSKVPVTSVSYTVTKTDLETVTGTYSVSASVTGTSQTIQVPLTKLPKLVLVTQTNDSYQLEDGYNYLSFLVVGPGGNGARYVSSEGISGAGGGGGGMAYCKNIPYPIPVTNVWRLNINSSYSRIVWENNVVSVTCDKGISGSAYEGGKGGTVSSSSTWHGGTLYKAGGTGGGGGDYDDYVCGGGAGTSGWGYENRGGTGGDGNVSNKGGGQYKGNYGTPFNGTRSFPIKTVFNGTGKGGDPFNNGGGGGGYGDGTKGGNNSPAENAGYGAGGGGGNGGSSTGLGGQGIICLYYHNTPL